LYTQASLFAGALIFASLPDCVGRELLDSEVR
jgi:hypothetical protein